MHKPFALYGDTQCIYQQVQNQIVKGPSIFVNHFPKCTKSTLFGNSLPPSKVFINKAKI